MKRFLSILIHPKFWLAIFILWLLTIVVASSFSTTLPKGVPKIPHLDKIMHFGYFMIGGVIFTNWILLKHGLQSSRFTRYLLPAVMFGLLGALDEYHQTFTPGRSGNDPYDWIADVFGASMGILLTNCFHPLLHRFSSPKTPNPQN